MCSDVPSHGMLNPPNVMPLNKCFPRFQYVNGELCIGKSKKTGGVASSTSAVLPSAVIESLRAYQGVRYYAAAIINHATFQQSELSQKKGGFGDADAAIAAAQWAVTSDGQTPLPISTARVYAATAGPSGSAHSVAAASAAAVPARRPRRAMHSAKKKSSSPAIGASPPTGSDSARAADAPPAAGDATDSVGRAPTTDASAVGEKMAIPCDELSRFIDFYNNPAEMRADECLSILSKFISYCASESDLRQSMPESKWRIFSAILRGIKDNFGNV